MNFLVTGAAGFLGSTLANRLAREGHLVRGLDDLSTGEPARLGPGVELTRGDVADRHALWTLLEGIDCVFHLAAKVSVPESIQHPRAYNAVNVGGTVSVMEAMRDVGVKRVVLISSGAVYGTQQDQPISEDTPPSPRSPYAVSKLAAEYYVHTIGNLWGIETVALRVFNAYGPGQPLPVAHPPVIPLFLHRASRGGTLVIHGRGEQTRDFVYVDDVLEAMLASATVPGLGHSIINIGSGTETSVVSLAQAVMEALGASADWMYNEDQDPGPSRMCADIQLAQSRLGYKPSVDLQEGLERMIDRDERFQPVRRP